MNQPWKNVKLAALFAIVTIAIATTVAAQSPQTPETWGYPQFIQAVENNTINKVKISADRARLLAESEDGNHFLVELSNEPDLIEILVRNQVDISVAAKIEPGEF